MNEFLEILDRDKPDWWIVYATQQELIDCVRSCTDERNGTVRAKNSLRKDVSERIYAVAQAGARWADKHKKPS